MRLARIEVYGGRVGAVRGVRELRCDRDLEHFVDSLAADLARGVE